MNTKESVVICVAIIGVVSLVLGITFMVKISDRLSELTAALSQPGVTSNISVDRFYITNPDDNIYFELEGVNASINSRVLDIVATALAGR